MPESVAGEMQNPLLQAVRIDDSRTRRTISLLAAEPETGKRSAALFPLTLMLTGAEYPPSGSPAFARKRGSSLFR
ncbi:hypothetical protein LJK87_49350 [Paenibacillus sp. P25]|nr:hypothetical protein LJK87_49350 [Paenibacillus sp. P25]